MKSSKILDNLTASIVFSICHIIYKESDRTWPISNSWVSYSNSAFNLLLENSEPSLETNI